MLDDLGLAASINGRPAILKNVPALFALKHNTLRRFPHSPTSIRCPISNISGNINQHCAPCLRAAYRSELDISPDIVSLKIHDDGRGIKANEISGTRSLGLLGMRERVKRLGGSFTIQGIPGEGTFLKVIIRVEPD